MPTYKNGNTVDVVLGSNRLGPGETIALASCYPTSQLPAGVTRESDSPRYNPVVASGTLTNGGDITIPDTFQITEESLAEPLVKFLVHVYVVSGSPVIKFNNTGVGKVGYAGMKWTQRFFERTVETINVTGTSVVVYSVEVI